MTDQPFATVLKNLTRELERLSSLAGNIDSAMGQLSVPADFNDEGLATLQRVDLLRQSLECLAHYVGELGNQVNETVLINPVGAAEALPLRDLARDLIGGREHDGHSMHAHGQDTCFF